MQKVDVRLFVYRVLVKRFGVEVWSERLSPLIPCESGVKLIVFG